LLLNTPLNNPQKTPILRAFLGWSPITGIVGCCARAANGHRAA
jgi:hypothetical protein